MDGNRVKAIVEGTPNDTITVYIGGYYEYEATGSTTTTRAYYSAGGQKVALRTITGTDNKLYYLLTDHLGSTSVSYRSDGGQTVTQKYKPWGELRSGGPLPTKYTYTGQYSEVGSFGLMFYKARWYDPALGRFNQPDIIVPEQTQGVQAWDRYGYVNNNPILSNDPSGHFLNVLGGALLGAAFGIGVLIVNEFIHPSVQYSAKDYFAAAGVGAASGALISTGLGIGAGVALGATLLGAGTGIAGSAIGYTAAAGSDYKTSEMLASAAVGGITGAMSGYAGIATKGMMYAAPFAKATISVGGSMLQTEALNLVDGKGTTGIDIGVSVLTGVVSYGIGQITEDVLSKTIGEIADDVVRSSLNETFSSWTQNKVLEG